MRILLNFLLEDIRIDLVMYLKGIWVVFFKIFEGK